MTMLGLTVICMAHQWPIKEFESWWSYFRKQRYSVIIQLHVHMQRFQPLHPLHCIALIPVCFRSQFWMDLLNDLRERGLFNNSHDQMCLLRFAFMEVLQNDLDEFREKWNTHTIRPVKQSRCPSGKPEVMYSLPHRFLPRNISNNIKNNNAGHHNLWSSLTLF